MSQRIKVLFLCTGNSCRSQMAEGWARHLKGDSIDAFSAGVEAHGLNPYAVRVMKEAGVDISQQQSNHLNDFKDTHFDLVVTVCSNAQKNCPVIPGAKMLHHGFQDPPLMSTDLKTEEEKLDIYRQVRDEIKDFISTLNVD